MSCKKVLYLSFIFTILKGTGGIYKPSARLKHPRRSIKYLTLTNYALCYICRTPLRTCGLVLTHHTLTRTRCIHDYLIKELIKGFSKLIRISRADYTIVKAHTLNVRAKYARTIGDGFIRDKESRLSCRLSRLASRRCAQVEHILSTLNIRLLSCNHSRRLLYVVNSCIMIRRKPRT